MKAVLVKSVMALLLVGLVGVGLVGCPPPGPDIAAITANFVNSIHGTRQGKITWYEGTEEEPGFEAIIGEPIEDLGCVDCHAATYANGDPVDHAEYVANGPGCGDCHVDPEDPAGQPVDMPTVCLGCHGRQAAELFLADPANSSDVVAARFSDVHRDAGMGCSDCHGFDEIHGDGNNYSSIMSSPSVACEDCHDEGGEGPTPPASYSHDTHTATLDCSACHIQTVLTCYNCHIESLVGEHVKRAAGQPNGFMLLMNRLADGKIYPGSYQSASYGGKKMIAIGGFYGHTVTKDGRVCSDCHNNANVQSYNETGIINLGTYDEEAQRVTGPSGVMPMPFDYKDAVKLDFLNHDEESNIWSIIVDQDNPENTRTPDLIQIAPSLVAPLSEAQMQKLSIPMGG